MDPSSADRRASLSSLYHTLRAGGPDEFGWLANAAGRSAFDDEDAGPMPSPSPTVSSISSTSSDHFDKPHTASESECTSDADSDAESSLFEDPYKNQKFRIVGNYTYPCSSLSPPPDAFDIPLANVDLQLDDEYQPFSFADPTFPALGPYPLPSDPTPVDALPLSIAPSSLMSSPLPEPEPELARPASPSPSLELLYPASPSFSADADGSDDDEYVPAHAA
ncbi:hypothetical protein BV25DRAFT_1994693, partial [Artomyces pyxidatus]